VSVILYSFRRCPYAMRARMALAVSGRAFELREVKLAAKPAAMIEASPKATVPVLVLPGGRVIDESREIMRWALLRHDPEHWLDGEDEALIDTNDGPFKHHLDRYKYPDRYDDLVDGDDRRHDQQHGEQREQGAIDDDPQRPAHDPLLATSSAPVAACSITSRRVAAVTADRPE